MNPEAGELKTCSVCERQLPLTVFSQIKVKDGTAPYRNPKCNQCRAKREKQQYSFVKKLELISTAKDKPCADCGGSFPPVCMDFDHLPGCKKEFSISSHWRWKSEKLIREEIAKCQVVCSNCHRIRTADRGYVGAGRRAVKTEILAEIQRDAVSKPELSAS